MDQRAPFPRISAAPPRGRVLVFAPHADDEVCGVGGTLALHAEASDAVHVVVAFDGRAGDPERHFRPEEFVRLRHAEARAGGAELGVFDYEFLDHPEGHLPDASELEVGARELAHCIERLHPDLVYAPWLGEHHLDHHVLALAVRRALALARFEGTALGYEVWTPLVPTSVIDITRVVERKRSALERHATQNAYRDLAHRVLGLNAQRSLYLPHGRYGEAFAPFAFEQAEERAA